MSREWRTAAACAALSLMAVPGIQLLVVGRRLLDNEDLLGRGYLLALLGAAMTGLPVGNAVAVAVGAPTARFTGLLLGVIVVPTSIWGGNRADVGWVGVVGTLLGVATVALLMQPGVLGFAAVEKPFSKHPPGRPPRDWTNPGP